MASLLTLISTAAPGTQLPATRQLVADLGVSPVTVQKALRTLEARGAIESRPGVGTFVRGARTVRANDYGWQTAALGSPRRRAAYVSQALRTAPNDAIALHSGYPDKELLPERLVRAAFTRVARSEAITSRPPVTGLPELQSWFAGTLEPFTPLGLTPPAASDALILPGSQSGLSSIFRSLVGSTKQLLIESPTYWGAMLAAEQAGVELVPVPSGPGGPDPEELARIFALTGARAFYAQPNFANPTGGQWSAQRADEVLTVIRDNGAFLIEDDWAHDFGITRDAAPLAARDDSGHVIYLRSLTKSVSPAVRVAGLIARGPARDRIVADLQAQSLYVSAALQSVALDVVTQPAWRTHLRSVRQQLAARRDLLVDSLAQHTPSAHIDAVPQGGLNLWVQLPDTVDVRELVRACESQGVIVAAGDDWFPAEPAGRYLRLNFAGPNPAAFPTAAAVLEQAITRLA